MTEKKNNGDFLRCVQELEANVPDELRPVWRKVAVHVLSLEQDVQRLKDDHTDPKTGEPIDVRGAYAALNNVVELMADVRRALAWAQAGVYIVGILGPIIVALGGYIWWTVDRQVQHNTKVNTEHGQMMERMVSATNMLSLRLDHLEQDEVDRRKGRR